MIRLVKRSLKVSLLALAVLATDAYSGELVRDAYVTEVANTNNNGADFAIILTGGTGVCTGSERVVITFPKSKFSGQSPGSYNQAFAIALTAFSTGAKVRAHNFEDNSCHGANFISVSK